MKLSVRSALEVLAVVLVSLTVAHGCSEARSGTIGVSEPTSSTSPPEIVRIGALLPLSGSLAAEGEAVLQAMQLAVDEINAGGGIASMGRATLVLETGDTQGEAQVAQEETARLAQDQGVAVLVGGLQSVVALPSTEVAENLGVPFVVCGAAADQITERSLTYTFRLGPKAEWYARDQVRFICSLWGFGRPSITKVALLHEDGPFGSETAADQRKYLEEAGIQVVAEVSYASDKPDLHDEVLSLKSTEAQMVLTATYLDDAVLIAEDAYTLRLPMPLFDAGAGTAEPEFLERTGIESEGILSQTPRIVGPEAAEFADKYRSLFGSEPTAAALESYQAIQIVVAALEKTGTTESAKIRDALAATDLVAGKQLVLPQSRLTFDESGQNAQAVVATVQAQGIRMVVLWPEQYATGSVEAVLPEP